ncbi:MAG: hypothetical protein OEZ14_15590 [Acidimicrobiia bacterium]|nr:hypothetical protein [Acidimicrobiia bacterium]MDH5521945.1 hypothetical protein [Acidimicrobiia bacterium]
MFGSIDIDAVIMGLAGCRGGVCTRRELLERGLQGYPLDPAADQSTVDVATAHGYSRQIAGVALHRRRRPTPAHDLIIIDGLPVTGPAMTIIDVAAVVGPAALVRRAPGHRRLRPSRAEDRRRDRR